MPLQSELLLPLHQKLKTCDCAQFPGQEAAMQEERARRGDRCADDNHTFFYIHGPASCTRCRWSCDVFRGRCRTCGYGDVCRKCAGMERFESDLDDLRLERFIRALTAYEEYRETTAMPWVNRCIEVACGCLHKLG
jgi:hypothetical protein